jgi:hypothetical protein
MKRLLLLSILIIHLGSLRAQKDSFALSIASTITVDDLKDYLAFIAGESTQGRETGTQGYNIASEYIASKFKMFGLSPINSSNQGYFQTFKYLRDISRDVTLYDSVKKFSFLKDFYVQPDTKNGLFYNKDVVFMGYGINEKKYNDYAVDTNLKDKIVIIMNDEPIRKNKFIISGTSAHSEWYHNMAKKLMAVSNYQPAAVVVVDDEFYKNAPQMKEKLTNYFVPYALKTIQQYNPPVLFTNMAVAGSLLGIDSAGLKKILDRSAKKKKPFHFTGKTKANIEIDRVYSFPVTQNVIGYIEGTDLKNEVVVISAHLDHLGTHKGKIYFGADDDGSGSASLLELAEAFGIAKRAGHGPRRSIVFIAFGGEEKGLLGSAHYVKNPVFPLANTVLDLNIDMVGRLDSAHANNPLYIYAIGSDKLSSELKPLLEKVNNEYTYLDLDYKYDDPKDKNRFYYRSDHYNFAKNKIPVIFFFNGTHADYHKPTDIIEKINFPKMTTIAKLVFYMAWDVANKDQRLKVDLELEEAPKR